MSTAEQERINSKDNLPFCLANGKSRTDAEMMHRVKSERQKHISPAQKRKALAGSVRREALRTALDRE